MVKHYCDLCEAETPGDKLDRWLFRTSEGDGATESRRCREIEMCLDCARAVDLRDAAYTATPERWLDNLVRGMKRKVPK